MIKEEKTREEGEGGDIHLASKVNEQSFGLFI